jgi:hypothetical protein
MTHAAVAHLVPWLLALSVKRVVVVGAIGPIGYSCLRLDGVCCLQQQSCVRVAS